MPSARTDTAHVTRQMSERGPSVVVLSMIFQRSRVFENRQVRASRLVMVVIMARWTMASWWSGLVS